MNSIIEAKPQSTDPLPFILPLIFALVLGQFFAPSFEAIQNEANEGEVSTQIIEEANLYTAARNAEKAQQYTWLIAVITIVVLVFLGIHFKVYLKHFPFRITAWGVLVGVIGAVLWITICKMHLEYRILEWAGLETWLPKRVEFDPWQIDSEPQRFLFLGFRFLLLAGLTPIFEELFLRGWLIRYVDNENWWNQSLGQLSFRACAAATLYGVVAHPGEVFAALVWFSLITFMMKRTGRFWDCVLAHMVTNLLLGLWVVYSGDWFLW